MVLALDDLVELLAHLGLLNATEGSHGEAVFWGAFLGAADSRGIVLFGSHG